MKKWLIAFGLVVVTGYFWQVRWHYTPATIVAVLIASVLTFGLIGAYHIARRS